MFRFLANREQRIIARPANNGTPTGFGFLSLVASIRLRWPGEGCCGHREYVYVRSLQLVCASHPWRDIGGFANPQTCHPWQVVRPSKSFAFCRLRRPGDSPCRVVPAIPGAAFATSPNPGLAIRGKSFGPQKALLFVGCADRASPMPHTPAAPLSSPTATSD